MSSAKSTLAVEGGQPVRDKLLPYGRQSVGEDDVAAVTRVLQSDYLTTGPEVDRFEADLAPVAGAHHVVAISNGTAALHAAMYALAIGPGDEVLVPTITFAASANAAVYQGATPVFVDVEPDTLLIDPACAAAKITDRTKAIVAVDYAGQPCDYVALRAVAEQHGLPIIADGCHAIGGAYRGTPVGAVADLTTFSFHPVKHVTTGEGGAISTDNEAFAKRMRVFRNHGITTEQGKRSSWTYEMVDLGYNYRLSDIQCALGRNQLKKLPGWIARRQEIAAQYDRLFAQFPEITPLRTREEVSHAYHLYVVQLNLDRLRVGRAEVYAALRAEGIGVNVHYIPVHLHPYYRNQFGTAPGLCPVAEAAYERILSLPMFPAMSDADVEDVRIALRKVCDAYAA